MLIFVLLVLIHNADIAVHLIKLAVYQLFNAHQMFAVVLHRIMWSVSVCVYVRRPR